MGLAVGAVAISPCAAGLCSLFQKNEIVIYPTILLSTVRLGDPDFFFQSTPFALKLRGHFINISMMILAKGI